MIAALLSRRLRRWLLVSVGVPAGAWGLKRQGEEVEDRRGQSPVANGLRKAGGWLDARRR
jgi:hypothetical protein